MSDRRRIVITGMGLVSPLGHSVDLFWERLLASQSGIRTIQRFDTTDFDIRIGGECLDFDPCAHMDRRAAKRLDRFAQMAVCAAKRAFDQSGLKVGDLDPSRIGVVTGTGIGGIKELEEQHLRLLERGPCTVSACTIPKLMGNAGSGNISILFDARGPSTTVSTACASATNAMGDAMYAIRRGDVDVMITGGAEAALTPLGTSAFASMKAPSPRNDEPDKDSRPFARDV